MKIALIPGQGVGRRSAGARQLGFGCVVLFALPFAAVGFGAGFQAVRELWAGDWRTGGFLSLFAVVFGSVGVGLAVAAIVARREAERAALVAARHPGERWLWREDWASGLLADSGRKGQYALWGFAALWNLIALPGALLALQEFYRSDNRLALIALIFPLVGVGMIVAAVRSTIRQRKFGISSLDLATRPGLVGHGLAGTVRIASTLLPADGFLATLSCVNLRTTGSGDDRSTRETIRWQEQRKVVGQRETGGPGRGAVTAIPIRFRLGPDLTPTDDGDLDDRIVWRLELTAGVPGVDYGAKFEVPVFRTAASSEPLAPDQERLLGPPLESLPYRPPADSPIRVSMGPRGTQIVFPAARNLGATLGLTGFTALWSGVLWLTIHLKAPVLFPLAFGLVEAALLYGALRRWVGVVEVTASREGVAVASGFGAAGDPTMIATRDVAGVEVKIGLQSGSTVYDDLAILRTNGRRANAGSRIRDKREAEWLAQLIRNAVGHSPQRRREHRARPKLGEPQHTMFLRALCASVVN